DMVLMPDTSTIVMDPFSDESTLIIRCDILEPNTMKGYERDPRSLAIRAEAYLKSTGIADTAYFGPENEFFIFDDVRWGSNISGSFCKVDSDEASWNTERVYQDGNMGHRPTVKGGYFPVPPVDALHDLRGAMCLALEEMGLGVEVHHHEVATAGQCEIGVLFGTLVKKADEVQILKYVIQNVAHAYGKTATFMPKPIVGDNGSGMHVHQSLAKAGKNLFAGNKYGGLSDIALYYIGGIIKHARALNAFTNASTNSYKRLVPGFEAPVMLAYSARNRSASIRIPHVPNPKGRRIEIRFPDSTANPYLAFSAMMMAGLDGIQNKIHPGDAMDKDLYDLPPEEEKKIPQVCHALDQALDALDKDRKFLKTGGVFTDDVIDAYISLKMQEVTRIRMTTHPIEFDMYYSL
ncbi:MAG: type I glutamate--ammonia ligase, partial [Gammaproteobacteria bacterium]|nr:type I glutamate--ammonia ligase [Gammaproteobacteria bacterium]